MGRPSNYTEDHERKVWELYREGNTYRSIGKKVKMPLKTVPIILRRSISKFGKPDRFGRINREISGEISFYINDIKSKTLPFDTVSQRTNQINSFLNDIKHLSYRVKAYYIISTKPQDEHNSNRRKDNTLYMP